MTEPAINVLFLCTHNSARSVLAEALLNHLGEGQFRGFSAGSQPRGSINPHTLRVLENAGIATEGLYSKSWDEFASPGSPQMDLVITVCDNAADEVCPYWPGQPSTVHWSYRDPSAVGGSDEQRLSAFRQTMLQIRRRLELLVRLPPSSRQRVLLPHEAHRLAES